MTARITSTTTNSAIVCQSVSYMYDDTRGAASRPLHQHRFDRYFIIILFLYFLVLLSEYETEIEMNY